MGPRRPHLPKNQIAAGQSSKWPVSKVIKTAGGCRLRLHGVALSKHKMLLASRKALDASYFLLDEITNSGYNNGIMAIAIPRPSAHTRRISNQPLHVIKVSVKNDRSRAEFKRECDILNLLSQRSGPGRRHIVELVASDTSERLSWFAMPFLRGPTLERLIDDGFGKNALPATFLFHYFEQMTTALIWLHEWSVEKPFHVSHGDLNLGNIIFDVSGVPSSPPKRGMNNAQLTQYLPRVVMVDFGCAAYYETLENHMPNMRSGASSISYDSPESYEPLPDEVDYFQADMKPFIFGLMYICEYERQVPYTEVLKEIFPGDAEFNDWYYRVRKFSLKDQSYFPTATKLTSRFSAFPRGMLTDVPSHDALSIWQACHVATGDSDKGRDIQAKYDRALKAEMASERADKIQAELDEYRQIDSNARGTPRPDFKSEVQGLLEAETLLAQVQAEVDDLANIVDFEVAREDQRNAIEIMTEAEKIMKTMQAALDGERDVNVSDTRHRLSEAYNILRQTNAGVRKNKKSPKKSPSLEGFELIEPIGIKPESFQKKPRRWRGLWRKKQ